MNITNIHYINLEHRKDRKEHVEKELLKIGMNGTRFNAIQMTNGAIGCSMSHLKLLQNAKANGDTHIMIVEDDITFTNPSLFVNQLNTFLQTHDKWDMILLAGNNISTYTPIDSTCVKVKKCQTTTGYIVNGHYLDKLINNVKIGLTYLLNNPSNKSDYAIDRYWFKLQEVDNWYLIIPLTVVQKEGYSDIEKRFTDYKNLMTNINKALRFI